MKKKGDLGKCIRCGKDFVFKKAGAELCSPNCRSSHYGKTHRDIKREQESRYRKANPEKKRAKDLRWYDKNVRVSGYKNCVVCETQLPEVKRSDYKYCSVQCKKKAYHKRRMADPNYKMYRRCKDRASEVLRKHNIKPECKLTDYIGCTQSELVEHISSKWKEGMNWQNHGKWHIDHIKPCASFDLTQESERRLCFHFTNLQPLWAKDNILKGYK